MTNLSLSVFNTLTPTKSAEGSYLEPGTYVARVARIIDTDPSYAKEQFENDEGEMQSIEDDIRQIKVTVAVDGVGTSTDWLSVFGFEKYDTMRPSAIPADFDYKALGTTKAAMTKAIKADWESAKAELFYVSTSGYAVRKDNNCRVTDFVAEEDGVTPARDEQGNHLSGPQSRKALEITENALFAMGMEGGIDSCLDNYVHITVSKRKSKQTGNERQSIRFTDPATKEEYDEAREELVD